MNLVEEFQSGDIIIGRYRNSTEVWTVVQSKAIRLYAKDANATILDSGYVTAMWTWTKIMEFKDFKETLEEMVL